MFLALTGCAPESETINAPAKMHDENRLRRVSFAKKNGERTVESGPAE
jgi:hypothetical protein